ncbi:MAG: sulfide/dihydroorotate dehydrogenase-like FAD/NAD-binding protein [Propionibacteriaceae bacterium]|jgi:glutamate synthase (NADPH/NADH) small chain|nr:sulfide/dihydroorotate dehydrogenase-like FAD/NAD-binding protein [Propionibacteriaceae bacterium]
MPGKDADELLERWLADDEELLAQVRANPTLSQIAENFTAGADFDAAMIERLWSLLLPDDATSALLMRFMWAIPVARKRLFIRGLDEHLSGRYPLFSGMSQGWPALVGVEPYIRPVAERNRDFELVNTGYLGYLALGFSLREVELFVWVETLRDRQCAESFCELGKIPRGSTERVGGCPVQIHIPTMFELIGQGRFADALAMLEECNPLPDVTGRVCPQELQCQGSCIHKHSMSIGQVEWFLPQWAKLKGQVASPAVDADPWQQAAKPPVAIVGSGPSGLIAAHMLAKAGFPVTVFEAFHELGGVLRYGIPEFRLPNNLIDDVVAKIKALGGRFVTSFVVGKTATLQDLRDAGFAEIFVGSGAGLPRFLNVPGEHLLNVMSANEFLTRVNLMQAHKDDHETPLPEVAGKNVIVVGGGNTAMDASRTALRLGGNVTICYRRTKSEMPAREEELEHALEEGVVLRELCSPAEFIAGEGGFVAAARVEAMELGEPDESGRRSPVPTGELADVPADLVIMALGNAANPIIKDSESRLEVTRRGSIQLRPDSQETSIAHIYSGGDAARGGSTAIRAAGDGRSAALEIAASAPAALAEQVAKALAYTEQAGELPVITAKRVLTPQITEFTVRAPAVARSAQAGQFVRVLKDANGELIPLTLADWDADAGTITLVIQDMGASSHLINAMDVGEAFAGVAGPLGRPSQLEEYPLTPLNEGEDDDVRYGRVVFAAGGLGLPPVYPILREHLQLGNHCTLISGFRSRDLLFWTDDYVAGLQAEFGDLLEVIYTTDDGSFGVPGFVTAPLEQMLIEHVPVAEVIAIGPPLMMRAVAELTRRFTVPCTVSVNSIMVDATGMCGACMVPITDGGELVRKHACIDGPEFDAHAIDWDKFLPRFGLFKAQERASRARLAS